MPYFDRKGIPLFYIDEPRDASPNQPVALLLHGWTCDMTDWVFQLPFLQKLGFRTIALDLRGHGHSAMRAPGQSDKDLDLSFETYADDAAALLAHLIIKDPVLVIGHSAGGTLTSIFSIRHPQLVKAIVVIDAPYYIPRAGHEWTLGVLDKPETMQPSIHNPHDVVTAIFDMRGYNAETPPWMITWHTTRRLAMEAVAFVEFYRQSFVGGDLRPAWEGASVGFTKEKRPQPRLAVVVNQERVEQELSLGVDEKEDTVECLEAGHWLHQQKADEFNQILEKWLGKNGLLPANGVKK